MNSNLEKAAGLLETENAACVFVREDTAEIFHGRGIKPLLALVSEGKDLTGFAAADRVIGKAAAFLHVMLGVRSVYAEVISVPALEVLKKAGADVHYETCTDRIINREGTGLCPMEAAVIDISDIYEAYSVLKEMPKNSK